MKSRPVLLASALCFVVALASGSADKPPVQPAERLVFPGHGFSILPLDEPGKGSSIALIMYLPASGNLAPNVNVLRQEYTGTLDEYVALSKTQFAQADLKVLSEKKTADMISFEYTGTMFKREMHWYSRAFWRPGVVYLVTATATETDWKDASAKLTRCVDSMALLRRQENAGQALGASANPRQ